ncbi:MAG: M15 family metallopeptidase [Eubacteriales bacterium]|nr:M15 family metallopeptidase [Eubacteriales bacterium]
MKTDLENRKKTHRGVRTVRDRIAGKAESFFQKNAAGNPRKPARESEKENKKSLTSSLEAVVLAAVLFVLVAVALYPGWTEGSGQSYRKIRVTSVPSGTSGQESAFVDEIDESPEIQTEGKAGGPSVPDSSLGKAFYSVVFQTVERTTELQQRAIDDLCTEFREILDKGEGPSYSPSSKTQKTLWEEVRRERKEELQKDPLLLLVNKWHYQPDGYEVEPVTLPNGQKISEICYEPLVRMLEDCAEEGGTPIVCSGYREHWLQVDLFSAQIQRWLNLGYGEEEAESLAATAVAVPGTSEHELGLAADIYSSENMELDESQVDTFTQQWLMDNCWRYGFVLRYPQDKSEITGIIFEPWHYRYVGKKHAEKIWRAGICLEEYLDETEHP